MNLRRHVLSLAVFLLAFARPGLAGVAGVDALANAPRRAPRALSSITDAPSGARVAHLEERFGVPTFVWAAPRTAGVLAPLTSANGSVRAESEARRVVADHAPLWGLAPRDVDALVVRHVHDAGQGPIVTTFRTAVDGIEIFREEMHVAMSRDLAPIAISGYLAPVSSLARSGSFRLDRREAVAIAVHDLTGASLDPGDLVGEGSRERQDPYEHLAFRPASATSRFLGSIRVKRVYFHLPDELVPAFYLDMRVGNAASSDTDYVAWVVSAVDGRVLFRHDLTAADSYSYRVWADTGGLRMPLPSPAGKAAAPHASGVPDGWQASLVAPSLVSLQNAPMLATNDPWLAAGATETNGNNADAYADISGGDGFDGSDLRARVTSPGVFDRTLDTAASPSSSSDQRMAVITQLFYDVNFFHDWYYASGFTEAAGNGQKGNYGRGGHQGDPVLAEAQDFSGRDNANMATPPDGESPRMQMYLFDGNGKYSVAVNAPSSLAGMKSSTVAAFGPLSFRITGDAVLVNNGTNLHDACTTPLANASALSGKIAIIDRGTCNFTVKVKNAQVAGATGVLLVDDGRGIVPMGGDDATITIPAMLIGKADGTPLKSAGGVNVTLHRDSAPDRDGGVDNQIVGHEWGHYISNRLVGDAMGLSTNLGGGLGEGWADFHALLLTVKEEDASSGFSGAYSIGGYVLGGYGDKEAPNQGYYYGVRRVPYSTDFTKDPLTFKHIEEGVALPTTAPLAYGESGVGNSEVHSTGEIWCSMLWESYAALLHDTSRFTFAQAQNRMKDILVAAYKLTPNAPTLLEARDAILAAALAFDSRDYVAIARAFARRGAGTRAVAPDRYDQDNAGVVESYLAAGDLALVSSSLDDGVVSCDMDGYLDSGETGRLTLVFRNVGTGPLLGSTVTFTPPAGVSLPGPAVVAVPPTQPLQTATVRVPVTITQATGVLPLAVAAVVEDPTFAEPLNLSLAFRANADDVAAQSATDDVESNHPVWAASGEWQRTAVTPMDHRWRALDRAVLADSTLVSPSFEVNGAFQVTFKHRYSYPLAYDANNTTYYIDGGVIEASTDGGSTWADVTMFGVPAYSTFTIYNGFGNPLGGHKAFAGTSAGFPAQTTKTLVFGPTLTGKSVKIRFRSGTTEWQGGFGWEVDEIAVTGISNKPFPSTVAHRAQCLAATSVTLDASPRSATYGDLVTLTATAAGATSGTVTFLDGGVAIGTGAIDGGGRATLQTRTLAVGTHSFTALREGTASAAPATSAAVTVTVGRASGATTTSVYVPIVLDVDNGQAHYVSEITLTNPGTLPVTATLAYTASMGSGTGTTKVVLAPGEQRIVPDALTLLRTQGLTIPSSQTTGQGGTLAVSFDNVSSGALPAATVRTGALTAAPQPVGYAGLAYGGLAPADVITSSAAIFGLRSSTSDRSHVAVFNTGTTPVTVKITVFSGSGDGRTVLVEGGKELAAGEWKQYSYVLDNAGLGTAGITTGWAVVERTSSAGSFGTYGVINDNTTNDGSFIQPVAAAPAGTGITLPVLVETPAFRSELVLANRGAASATLALAYRESNTPGAGAGGVANVTLAAGEQRIIAEVTDWLRTNGVAIGAKDAASYVGSVRVTVSGVPAANVFVGARTASQSPAGGQFGLFTPGIYSGQEASTSAALYGLRVDLATRSNVAVLNAGSDSAGPVTLSIQAYDGAASGVAKGSPTVVTLQPGEWRQYGSILSDARVADGWVVVRRTSGSAPWITYAVINDGGAPGERTGDGAYVPMTR